jgi:glutamate racemase
MVHREQDAAIGVFDSGVGGLTVVRRLAERLPSESIVYLGDTARVPYGTKSEATVIRYAQGCASILVERGIKLLVVACNTASAYALDVLRDELDVPVIGVVEPGARAAVAATRNRRVGVIGTAGTVHSGVYPRAIHALDDGVEVHCKPCPLFVPLAEEGWTTGTVAFEVARTYLTEFAERGIDTLVLGCTHYPLLKETIGAVMGASVTLVDSAEATADAVSEVLSAMDAARIEPAPGPNRFLVTDAPESIARVGARFLGHDLNDVEWVDF